MWEFAQPQLGKIKLDRLKIDQAFLNLTSSLNEPVWMYTVSDDCVECPFKQLQKIAPDENVITRIDATRQSTWAIFKRDVGPYATMNHTPHCIITPDNFGQFGVYNLHITDENCEFSIAREPVNVNLSIILVIVLLTIIYGSIRAGRKLYEQRTQKATDTSASASTANLDDVDTELKKPKSRSRIVSLDAFRGLAIVCMIFANCGAGRYWWLEHATWDGLHFADFVFPSFLWIMGVCIPISIKSQLARNVTKRALIVNIAKRSLKLFFIGLCIHTINGPKLGDVRIMGVLQRFGIAYFVVASLHVVLTEPITNLPDEKWKKMLYDIILLIPHWIVSLCLIIIYFIISFAVAVPGCTRGYLGPGGVHKMGAYDHCIGGATGYLDRVLLGERHLYQYPRAGSVYGETLPFDPEGLVGCLMTIVQVFIGVQCGMTLLIHTEWKERVKRWSIWGVSLIFLGLVLGLIPGGEGIIPINKNLWSLSYVLVTSGVAFSILTFLYFIIDVKSYWSGIPLVYAGMNAIIMYIGSEILHKMYPFYWHIGAMNTHFAALLQNIWTTGMWVLVAYYLYLKEVFITL